MGFQEKHEVVEAEAEAPEIWVIAGISLRAPLKPVRTSKPPASGVDDNGGAEQEEEEKKTPVRRRTVVCPPAPKKPKPSFVCRLGGGVEFFAAPEDLRAVFLRREERSK
ncbi:cyclin-dependent protein kinase inhibitor SMR6 [Iris pallida]|uniref:Cyclin-dependent protein kinase inhibitor SMR6 n=1 Tax=Iris pallida TaxID=29817 RepID=A0AAX6F2X4_IRIPA|nr:cyclin-dependent protein kinase inhibitor SMR6 [Iris pallida]